jgi:tetratricopeptide (TPR) repeat protein
VLAGSSPANRTWLISHAVVTYGDRPAWDVLSELAPQVDVVQDRKAVHVLDFVRASSVEPKRATRPEIPLREPGVLEEELAAADDAMSKARTDPEANLRFGRTALELARRKIQDGGGSGIDLLLEDARTALARAAESRPDDFALALDRARVANLLSRFEEQEQIAGAALERSGELWNRSGPTLTDEQVEACRWLGDASARLLSARSGKDMAVETAGIFRGGLAFALAASSLESDPTDWLSLASYFAALGRTRERVELVYEGLRRFPASEDLRRELTNACWSLGRPDLLARLSQELAIEQPAWAESEWYAGYALVLCAESLRRVEDADGAISAYSSAEQHFAAALELEPGFRDSSEHYLGMSALGRGFANLLANRRAEAAQCVVEAAKVRPQTFAQRDGLEREGVDLVDGVLEWRASGASPVDALAWIDDLLRADPGNATWPRTISDAQLREGLRAFGRDAPEEGDAYLAKAVGAARRAVELDPSDANRRALAQASNVTAERLLERGSELERARALVAEAAGLVEVEPPAPNAALDEVRKSAAAVRSKLGAARPVFRPGR